MQSTGRLYYNDVGEISADGVQEVLDLFESLSLNGYISIDVSLTHDNFLEGITQGNYFSVIGASYWFGFIKNLVSQQSPNQEWKVARLPKSDFFTYDVSIGGNAWMVVNKEGVQDQTKVYYFLTQAFGSNLTLMRKFAEDYDIVPASNLATSGSTLDGLSNNGCFTTLNVIKFLAEKNNIPEIYYGTYTQELNYSLNEIVNDVICGIKPTSQGDNEFSDICIYYTEIGPVIPKGLEKIEIEDPPTKTDYYKYESFNSSGMVVKFRNCYA